MLSELRVTKQALSANIDRDTSSNSTPTDVRALLELNALIDRQPDCWVAYCLRGRINATLERYVEAISDCTQALKISKSLNGRNKRDLINSITVYADKLSASDAFSASKLGHTHTCVLPEKAVSCKSGEGRIKNLGKFLFDASDIEKLIQLYRSGDDGESSMRWLTTYSF